MNAIISASKRSSVILVGMPGSGKSTLGVLLAKRLGKQFVDTDLLIQLHTGETLQQTLDSKGYLYLRAVEEEVLLETRFRDEVVATGGSAVYSDAGMRHLQQFGAVVFLDLPLTELRQRVQDFQQRGIARRPNQSFESLFDERRALYQRYAEIKIDCTGLTHEQALEAVESALNNLHPTPG